MRGSNLPRTPVASWCPSPCPDRHPRNSRTDSIRDFRGGPRRVVPNRGRSVSEHNNLVQNAAVVGHVGAVGAGGGRLRRRRGRLSLGGDQRGKRQPTASAREKPHGVYTSQHGCSTNRHAPGRGTADGAGLESPRRLDFIGEDQDLLAKFPIKVATMCPHGKRDRVLFDTNRSEMSRGRREAVAAK